MVTGKQVYDMALVLIDEVTEVGEALPDTPRYYEAKSRMILSQLQAELLPVSKQPVVITDLTKPLLVSDRLAISVLPYGLAAHLLMTEELNMNAASFFNARYDELKAKQTTSIQPITDSLGVLGGMQ